MKKIIIFFICFFAVPVISFAACTSEQTSTFRKMANNVNVSYKVTSYAKNGTPIFEIDITNLAKDMSVVTLNSDIVTYKAKVDGAEYKIPNLTKSGKYEFIITSDEINKCSGDSAPMYDKKTITLPTYNKYYTREECKELTNYAMCKKWSNYSANEATFKNDVEKAKKEIENKKEIVEDTKVKKKKTWYNGLTQIFAKYWWAFIIVIVIALGVYYVIRMKAKKNQYDFKV